MTTDRKRTSNSLLGLYYNNAQLYPASGNVELLETIAGLICAGGREEIHPGNLVWTLDESGLCVYVFIFEESPGQWLACEVVCGHMIPGAGLVMQANLWDGVMPCKIKTDDCWVVDVNNLSYVTRPGLNQQELMQLLQQLENKLSRREVDYDSLRQIPTGVGCGVLMERTGL